MKSSRTFRSAVTLAASLLTLAATSSTAQAACDPSLEVVEISIKDMAFVPSAIEVCVGQVIRWTNNETAAMVHTVTADPARARNPENVFLPEGAATFHSGPLARGRSFETTLSVVGEYKYFCQPHELMGHVGTITVVDPAAEPVDGGDGEEGQGI